MAAYSRRKLLGVSFAATAGLAGCLEADPTADPEDNESEPPANSPDNGTEPSDGNESPPEFEGDGFEVDVTKFVHGEQTEEPTAELLVSRSGAEGWLEELPEGTMPPMDDVIAEADFDHSVLVSLTGHGPDLCYDITVSSVEVRETGGEEDLHVEAAVQDTSAEDESCAQQVVTVGALLVVTFDGEPVQRLSTTITGADGTVHESAMATESVSEAAESE